MRRPKYTDSKLSAQMSELLFTRADARSSQFRVPAASRFSSIRANVFLKRLIGHSIDERFLRPLARLSRQDGCFQRESPSLRHVHTFIDPPKILSLLQPLGE